MEQRGGRLSETAQRHNAQQTRILLGLLESVDRDQAQSQRRLATELGIALGLLNAYLKRCIRKGLVKVRRAPTRRYAYFLTPRGFAEKSRLTVEYLAFSLDFFRQAKSDCQDILEEARRRGYSRIVFLGRSDLAEIAAICALETGVEIVAVVDRASAGSHFMRMPVVADFDQIEGEFHAALVTDLVDGRGSYERAVAAIGAERVLTPKLLRISSNGSRMT